VALMVRTFLFNPIIQEKKEILIENICIELPRFTEKAKVASHSATASKQVSVNW
jgi:hypothetical protein